MENDYTYRQRKYYESKNRCPKCGEKNFAEAYLGYIQDDQKLDKFIDNKNKVFCRTCGWNGKIDQLLK